MSGKPDSSASIAPTRWSLSRKSLTPFLTTRVATISLVVFVAVYTLIFAFGTLYIYRLLREGPGGHVGALAPPATPSRPMSLADQDATAS